MSQLNANSLRMHFEDLINHIAGPNEINPKLLHSSLHFMASKLDFKKYVIKLPIKEVEEISKDGKFDKPTFYQYSNKKIGEEIVGDAAELICQLSEEKTPVLRFSNVSDELDVLENSEVTQKSIPLSIPTNKVKSNKIIVKLGKFNEERIYPYEKCNNEGSSENEIEIANSQTKLIWSLERTVEKLENRLSTFDQIFRNYEKTKHLKKAAEKTETDICEFRNNQIALHRYIRNFSQQLNTTKELLNEIETKLLLLQKIPIITTKLNNLISCRKQIEFSLKMIIKKYVDLHKNKSDYEAVYHIIDTKIDKNDLIEYATLKYFDCIQKDLYKGVGLILEENEKSKENRFQLFSQLNKILNTNFEKTDLPEIKAHYRKSVNRFEVQMNEKLYECFKRPALEEHDLIVKQLDTFATCNTIITKDKGNKEFKPPNYHELCFCSKADMD